MRWLANHYGKQKEMMKWKASDRQSKWQRWPQHLTAPTKADARVFDAHYAHDLHHGVEAKDLVYNLGTNIQVIPRATHVFYYDGAHSLTFSGILFPDGTEWWPLHASND